MGKIRVFTSFSGYDSQCLALDRLGVDYELVGWSEIDKYAIKAHNALYPQWAERNFGDISKIDWAQVPDFDLFTYSSPCQDFSQAGLQRGGEQGSGTRSSLLWECQKAIEAKRPKYCLMENVAALVTQKFVKLFNKWQLVLEQLGYRNFAQVLNAKDYGVPQNRERIFLVSILNADKPYYFPQPFALDRRLKDVLESNVDEKYYLSDSVIESFNAHKQRNAEKGNGFGLNPTDGDCVGNAILTGSLRATDNYIKQEPINTTAEGLASCLKSDYCKMGGANFLHHTNDGFKATAVKVTSNQRGREVHFKVMDNGNIRAFQPTPDKRGVSELQFQNPENIAFTITTAHEPKIIEKNDE